MGNGYYLLCVLFFLFVRSINLYSVESEHSVKMPLSIVGDATGLCGLCRGGFQRYLRVFGRKNEKGEGKDLSSREETFGLNGFHWDLKGVKCYTS